MALIKKFAWFLDSADNERLTNVNDRVLVLNKLDGALAGEEPLYECLYEGELVYLSAEELKPQPQT